MITAQVDLTRTVVVGSSCCGKTTFARALAAALHVPHIELDALHWKPGWVERNREDFRTRVTDAVSPDRWVIDGNYAVARDIVWARVTAVVWLNYGFATVFGRAVRRTFRRVVRGEELFSGNRETLGRALFSTDSILLWVIRTYHHRRRRYRLLLRGEIIAGRHVVEFQKPSEADGLLATVAAERKR